MYGSGTADAKQVDPHKHRPHTTLAIRAESATSWRFPVSSGMFVGEPCAPDAMRDLSQRMPRSNTGNAWLESFSRTSLFRLPLRLLVLVHVIRSFRRALARTILSIAATAQNKQGTQKQQYSTIRSHKITSHLQL